MAFPRSEEDQILWWERQVEYGKARIKPFFDASDILIKEYNNQAASMREIDVEAGGTEDEHTRRVKANLIYGWIDQSIANLVDREPVFSIKPKRKDAVDGAPVVSALTNHYYRETGQLRHDERCLQDAFLTPWGVNKIGWTTDVEMAFQEILQPDATMAFDDPQEEILFLLSGQKTAVVPEQDHEAFIELYVQVLQDPTLDDDLQNLLEDMIKTRRNFQNRSLPDASEDVKWESPFGIRWEPDKFIPDWMAQDGIHDARWVAFLWELPVEEVKANPIWENTSDLEPTFRAKDAPIEDPELGDQDGFGLVRGMEIWAKNFPVGRGKFRDCLWVIAEGHKKFLRKEDEWPYSRIRGYPCEVLSFQTGVKTWFNNPALIMSGSDTTQGLVNEILDSYLYVIRKQKNIWLYDPGLIEESTLENIISAPDMSIFPVEGLADAKGAAIIPLPFAGIPSEKGELLRIVQQFMDRSAGTPQPTALPTSETATEASIIERRNTSREDRRAKLFSRFQLDKAEKFWQLLTQFRPDQVDQIHPDAQMWLEASEEVVKGGYRFDMDISSSIVALEMERKQHLDLLNLVAGLAPLFQQLYGQAPRLDRLLERVLTRGYEENRPEDIIPWLAEGQQEQVPQQPQVPPQEMGNQASPDSQVNELVNQALQAGQTEATGIGPADDDTFNRAAPDAGKQQGAAITP